MRLISSTISGTLVGTVCSATNSVVSTPHCEARVVGNIHPRIRGVFSRCNLGVARFIVRHVRISRAGRGCGGLLRLRRLRKNNTGTELLRTRLGTRRENLRNRNRTTFRRTRNCAHLRRVRVSMLGATTNGRDNLNNNNVTNKVVRVNINLNTTKVMNKVIGSGLNNVTTGVDSTFGPGTTTGPAPRGTATIYTGYNSPLDRGTGFYLRYNRGIIATGGAIYPTYNLAIPGNGFYPRYKDPLSAGGIYPGYGVRIRKGFYPRYNAGVWLEQYSCTGGCVG